MTAQQETDGIFFTLGDGIYIEKREDIEKESEPEDGYWKKGCTQDYILYTNDGVTLESDDLSELIRIGQESL